MIQHILFDHDGTLVDSESIYFGVEQKLVQDMFGKVISWEWYEENKLGMCVSSAKMLQEELDLNDEDIEKYDQATDLALDLALVEQKMVPFYEGVESLLERTTLPYSIVTSNNRKRIEELHEGKNGLLENAVMMVAYEDVKKRKPDPEPYLLACEKLGYEPSECLAVEDSTPGVSSALAAGCITIAIGSHSPREGLVVVKDHAEMIEMIERMTKS